MKILIVDDSRAIQTIVRRALAKEGFANEEFRLAGNGAEALEIVTTWLPDLVITDWHMPEMTGLEMLQAIQQTQQKRLLVGFVTTESLQERLQEAVRNGAAFVIPKPFTDRQLGDAVRQAIADQGGQKPAADVLKESGCRASEPGAIESYLHQLLKAQVTIQEARNIDFDSLMMPWMIGFYGLGEKTEARGTCVLDRFAMALIGGSLAGLTPTEIPGNGPLPVSASDQVASMLKFASFSLFMAPVDQPVTLLRSQLVAQANPKLKEILAKSPGKRVYRIGKVGFSSGLMTLIAR